MTKFLFNIEPELLKKIKREAKLLKCSTASFLRRLINDYFNKKQ